MLLASIAVLRFSINSARLRVDAYANDVGISSMLLGLFIGADGCKR